MSKKLAILSGVLSLALVSATGLANAAAATDHAHKPSAIASIHHHKQKHASAHSNKWLHMASVRSELSKKCSAEADAKNLHGKDRRVFRHHCINPSTAQLPSPGSAPKTSSVPAATPSKS